MAGDGEGLGGGNDGTTLDGDSKDAEADADATANDEATDAKPDASRETREDAPADIVEVSDTAPVRVMETATQVSIGIMHTCARLRDATVACWGDNYVGELGDGTFDRRRPNATPVADIRNATQIAGTSAHTCARLDDGTMKCWGSNVEHELGVDTTERCGGGACSRTPKSLPGLNEVEEVGAGAGFTCARLKDKSVRCWGGNRHGYVGDGTYVARPTPTRVLRLEKVTELSVSEGHVCARIDDGSVKCWGGNGYGQLGFVSTDCLKSIPEPHSECSTTAQTVKDLSDVVQIASGTSATCARSSDGSVRCWGREFGRRPLLVVKDSAQDIAAFTGGCARTNLSKVTCWSYVFPGDGTKKRDLGLGLGGVEVPSLTSVARVAMGRHQCVVLTAGAVKCWGYNESGQLGDGTTLERLTPVSVLW